MAIETTYRQAHESLKSLMDRAVQDREVALELRRHGGDVALVAADELSSLLKSAHLLRSPANAERVAHSPGQGAAAEAFQARSG